MRKINKIKLTRSELAEEGPADPIEAHVHLLPAGPIVADDTRHAGRDVLEVRLPVARGTYFGASSPSRDGLRFVNWDRISTSIDETLAPPQLACEWESSYDTRDETHTHEITTHGAGWMRRKDEML